MPPMSTLLHQAALHADDNSKFASLIVPTNRPNVQTTLMPNAVTLPDLIPASEVLDIATAVWLPVSTFLASKQDT